MDSQKPNPIAFIVGRMEDSFRVRVDRIFGSLASSSNSTSSSSSLTSLWSLTDADIQKKEWNRSKGSPEPEPETEPQIYRGRGDRKNRSGFRDGLEKDLEDIDEEEDEDVELKSRGPLKPDDYDDEQWEIKSSIGRDCTLDYEVVICFSYLIINKNGCFNNSEFF